jgi:hypothetical protein
MRVLSPGRGSLSEESQQASPVWWVLSDSKTRGIAVREVQLQVLSYENGLNNRLTIGVYVPEDKGWGK